MTSLSRRVGQLPQQVSELLRNKLEDTRNELLLEQVLILVHIMRPKMRLLHVHSTRIRTYVCEHARYLRI